MKKCPQCSRTYSDETLSFCLEDGALLSAPYDPDETSSPTVAINAPEILPTVEANQIPPTVAMPEIPPTVASSQPPPVADEQEIPTVVAEKPRETQTEDKKVRWYIYLAGFFIAVVYYLVMIIVLGQSGTAGVISGFFDFFLDSDTDAYRMHLNQALSGVVLVIIVFGSLGTMLGYKWHRAKWKWGLITALAEIPFAPLIFYAYPKFEPPLIITIAGSLFLILVALTVGSGASHFGSTLRRKAETRA